MFRKVTDNIHIMDYDDDKARPLLALIKGREASLIVDAGNSDTHAKEFIDYVKSSGTENAEYLAITHWHWDHIYGINYMNLTTLGSEKTKQKIGRMNDILRGKERAKIEEENTVAKLSGLFEEHGRVKNIDISFDRIARVNLGNITCVLECLGGDHASDSTLIYVEEEKVMFLGDMPYRGFEGKYRTHHFEQVKRLRDEIMKYDCEKFFTAHKEMYTREEMSELLNTMTEIGGIVDDSIEYEKSEKEFIEVYGRKPDEDEEFFMRAYIDGNIYNKENKIK